MALCSNDASLCPEHAKNYLRLGCREVSSFSPHPPQPRTSNLHPWSGSPVEWLLPWSACASGSKQLSNLSTDHRIQDDSKLDGMKLMLKLPNWNNIVRQKTLHDIFVLWGGFKVHKVVLNTTFNGVMGGNFFLSWQRLIGSCITHQCSCCLCITCMYTRSTLYTNTTMHIPSFDYIINIHSITFYNTHHVALS